MAVPSSLNITLTRRSGEDAMEQRSFTLQLGSSIDIGRASKTESKCLMAASDNCWIQNPVISRRHAELAYKMDETDGSFAGVYLSDVKSSHGTFVNKSGIKGKPPHMLHDRDIVQFGDLVDKAGEIFQPPSYLINIAQPRTLHPTTDNTKGRTIECPEDISDDSGVEEESDSEAESDDSHSSLPAYEDAKRPASSLLGSYDNPLTVDDDITVKGIFIDLAESRDASVHHESVPRIPEPTVVQDTYAQEWEKESYPGSDYSVQESDNQEDDDDLAESEASKPNAPPSPVYAPASPRWSSQSSSFLPRPSAILPEPAQRLDQNATSNVYWDGPFSQGHQPFPVDELPPLGACGGFTIGDYNYNEGVPGGEWFPEAEKSKPTPDGQNRPITLSTQNFLGKMPAPKNDMSIHSLINPPVANAPSISERKRKAGVMQAANQHSEQFEPTAMTSEASTIEPMQLDTVAGASAGVPFADVKPAEVVAIINEAPVVQAVEARPSKRMRTVKSFATGFIFGAMGTLAGLMALPDGIFA